MTTVRELYCDLLRLMEQGHGDLPLHEDYGYGAEPRTYKPRVTAIVRPLPKKRSKVTRWVDAYKTDADYDMANPQPVVRLR